MEHKSQAPLHILLHTRFRENSL